MSQPRIWTEFNVKCCGFLFCDSLRPWMCLLTFQSLWQPQMPFISQLLQPVTATFCSTSSHPTMHRVGMPPGKNSIWMLTLSSAIHIFQESTSLQFLSAISCSLVASNMDFYILSTVYNCYLHQGSSDKSMLLLAWPE